MKKYNKIISLGYDCNVATALKEMNLRFDSLPFDWLVSLDTEKVIDCIVNDFNRFYEVSKNEKGHYVNYYGFIFLHHSHFNEEEFKREFDKKIKKFKLFMQSNEDILFCRKLHGTHEDEFCKKVDNANEFKQMSRLREFLDKTYVENKIDILTISSCKRCEHKIKNNDSNKMFYSEFFFEEEKNGMNKILKEINKKI